MGYICSNLDQNNNCILWQLTETTLEASQIAEAFAWGMSLVLTCWAFGIAAGAVKNIVRSA